jgi:hypothetical protein
VTHINFLFTTQPQSRGNDHVSSARISLPEANDNALFTWRRQARDHGEG